MQCEVKILESTIYTVAGKEFELRHYGVKGMKWGKRKARSESVSNGRRGGKASADSPEAQAAAKAARRQKAKRAVKIGAAVVGTALAVYGAKKLSDTVKNKAYQKAYERGAKEIKKYMLEQNAERVIKSMFVDEPYAASRARKDLFKEAQRLRVGNEQYAKRASRNTVAAVKELLGKNYELPTAQLKRMGIKTFDPYL